MYADRKRNEQQKIQNRLKGKDLSRDEGGERKDEHTQNRKPTSCVSGGRFFRIKIKQSDPN